MDSHLGNGSLGDNPRRTVYRGSEIDKMAGADDGSGYLGRHVHGRVVNADQIRSERMDQKYGHGNHGSLEGAPVDPRARMHTEMGLPPEAANWEGSATLYADNELPTNDFMGMGFHGTEAIYTPEQMMERDKAAGTYHEYLARKQQQGLEPGAYQLNNGKVLLIGKEGQRAIVSPQEYQKLQQQAQQARITQQSQGPNSLVDRVLRAATGK